ncbi:MAG TPA: RelA/SpoT family protein [Bacteroidales bacterium]|nr:bifunctional (p)ppGpp synthetase/guanosine-3',5'-bis(diphosphate) 3'-pyrophosphohydrolase [Bacteroidales bacterium]HOU95646.1 RelA/SpoT family protein [Bacteroidales bacterium]HQG36029.1 RelA/SpoT family protein [Bacteroidales bacterium]HQJ20345.1 RelA/SpoT family protein [Bacteroidales bacterium]
MQSKQVYTKYRALLLTCNKLIPAEDVSKIRKAIDILVSNCEGKTTTIGSSIILHALNVSLIVVQDLGLGISSITGSLLYHAWDSIKHKKDEISQEFGENTLKILEGLAKINVIEPAQTSYQSEGFRKLMLSLAEDVRVILIRLAERLDLMRNLDSTNEKEKLSLASETYFLYAPLAHRLGLYNIKSELEDLSIKYLEPEQYNFINEKLKQTASSRNKLIREFTAPIRERLLKQGFKFTIKSRTKSIHSILSKMRKQGVEFEEVYDIFAVRIIVDSEPQNEKSDCWQVYSIVTDLYQPNPSRLRDWISVPKSNGYESLHTTVIGPGGKWVEVQIRTKRMDEIAEKGLAAHYKYKGLNGDSGIDRWLSRMREILESSDKDDSFIDQIKPGLYSDEVFVFTPKGDLRQLPAGSTVLDFAFDIHSEIGCTCVGAKVNGKNVTIRHVLQNGDHVSILTSRNQKPNQDWLSFVVTSKAKNKIKQALNEEKALAAAEGKEILIRRLKNWKITYSDAVVKKLQSHYQLRTAQDLYCLITDKKIDLHEIKEILTRQPEKEKEASATGEIKLLQGNNPATYTESVYADYLIIDEKVEGLDYKLAKCCNPIFGDRIFGFVTISEGIKVHRLTCPNAQYLITKYPYRVINARWSQARNMPAFRAAIKITGIEEIGIVNRITDIISDYKVTLRNFNYNMEDGMFEGTLQIMVPNNNVLQGIIKKILSVKGVLRAVRQESSGILDQA